MDRILKLQKVLNEQGIDCALLLYHRDVYYYAGTARPAALVITPNESVLFSRRATRLVAQESKVSDTRQGGLSAIFDWLRDRRIDKGSVAVEMDILPASMYMRLNDFIPGSKIVDVSPYVLEQRLVKDEEEVECIRGACRMAEEAHRILPETIRHGMTELELAAELERAARISGHETFAILRKRMETEMGYALLLSGDSTKVLGGYGQVVTGTGLSKAFPYGPSTRRIIDGDVVVFDIAGLKNGYHSDLARTYVLGNARPEVREAHSALAAIQSEMLEVARPGRTAEEIYDAACKTARSLGWDDYFQGPSEQRGTFVGHGLGLEIDEPPLLSPGDRTVIKENMTFTTEIFIVHPTFGEVKLEDTVLITSKGASFLTKTERRLFEL